MGANVQVMRRDEVSGAPTLLYKVLVDRGVSWGGACEQLSENLAAAKASAERAEVWTCVCPWNRPQILRQ